MFDIISVTNRKLCKEDFLLRIEKLANSGVSKIILREKDLSPNEYLKLAQECRRICENTSAELIVHTFFHELFEAGFNKIHMPLPILEENPQIRQKAQLLGVSVHSKEQAEKALALGADYLTAGHIFATDCKKGVPPRGLDFLKEICDLSPVPVYAIGGITSENAPLAAETGAKGVCIMSGLMECENPYEYVKAFKNTK